jgi:predicted nucleotidyltransferase
MKHLDSVPLTSIQYQALVDLQQRVADLCDMTQMILYGSVTRNEADEESDLDLLIVTTQPLTRPARHEITDVVFDVNLRCGSASTRPADRRLRG